MNDIGERLRKIAMDNDLSINEFERLVGFSKGFISKVKNPTAETIQKVCGYFPIVNPQWLLTGEGEMFNHNGEKKDDNSSPCFDIATIQGGSGHGTGMEQLTPGMEMGRMLVPGLKTGSDIPYIQVRGNSMVNHKNPARSIPGGAWLGVKASTLNTIMWGEVYAIMTTDGPIVKKIIQSDKEGYIRCVSFNEEEGYAPFDLPCTDIIQPLYNIVGVVSVKSWE